MGAKWIFGGATPPLKPTYAQEHGQAWSPQRHSHPQRHGHLRDVVTSETQSPQRCGHLRDTVTSETRSPQRHNQLRDTVTSETQSTQRHGHLRDEVTSETQSPHHLKEAVVLGIASPLTLTHTCGASPNKGTDH